MAYISITRKFEFESCHFLNDDFGACARMHGHSYKLEVTVRGVPENNGMITDFGNLKILVKEIIIDQLDHNNLNLIKDENGRIIFKQPTAENMVMWIVTKLTEALSLSPVMHGCTLQHVRLYETSNSHADWDAGE